MIVRYIINIFSQECFEGRLDHIQAQITDDLTGLIGFLPLFKKRRYTDIVVFRMTLIHVWWLPCLHLAHLFTKRCRGIVIQTVNKLKALFQEPKNIHTFLILYVGIFHLAWPRVFRANSLNLLL